MIKISLSKYKFHLMLDSAKTSCVWRKVVLLAIVVLACFSSASAESTRKERRLILDGNMLYRTQKFAEAKVKYRNALSENESSAIARFNLGLCDVRLARLNKDNDSIAKKLMGEATSSLLEIAKLGKENPSLASKANYNLGNLEFDSENYQGAIQYYKQALRLDPGFNDARRNLRIAQLKLQNQQQNQDDKDKEDKDKQNQDKQDQDKQNQDQQDKDKQDQDNKDNDQNKDNNEQNRDQQKPRPNELSDQAAQQILNAVENNEQRARQSNNKGEKAHGRPGSLKKW